MSENLIITSNLNAMPVECLEGLTKGGVLEKGAPSAPAGVLGPLGIKGHCTMIYVALP